jgi:hypothetical protein
MIIETSLRRVYLDHIVYYDCILGSKSVPNGKYIDPTTDHSAKQMENGSWKCGVCVASEENTKKLSGLMRG